MLRGYSLSQRYTTANYPLIVGSLLSSYVEYRVVLRMILRDSERVYKYQGYSSV
jgi:hypothetical protein